MTHDPRQGIRAKHVYLSFTDAVRDDGNYVLTDSKFTDNEFAQFWGAYYGGLVENLKTYSLTDLGFDSTGCTEAFGTAVYDTIATIVKNTITLTTNTSMTADAHIDKYIIVRKANGKKIFARITDNATSTITTDKDLTAYSVATGDTLILLKVPFGLTMDAYQRLDHIATDYNLSDPATETTDQYFLGSSDAEGSQNSNLDSGNLTKRTGSVTIRGGLPFLKKLKYQTTTSPSGTVRYNLGGESTTPVGLVAIYSTNPADPDSDSASTEVTFCNNITITNIGGISVSSDGRATATVEFEVKGSDCRTETYETQDYDTDINV